MTFARIAPPYARLQGGLLLFCSLALGCGKTGEFETAPVTGTVTLNGTPLSKGTVTFIPEHGKMATGSIQPDGTFSLSTYAAGDGAIVGKCRAAVTVLAGAGEANEDKPRQKSPVPGKYAAPETSGLEYEVSSTSKNSFHIELKGAI